MLWFNPLPYVDNWLTSRTQTVVIDGERSEDDFWSSPRDGLRSSALPIVCE